ncbi:hypothetical protein MKW98_031074, partial [Papaver atlanticum]
VCFYLFIFHIYCSQSLHLLIWVSLKVHLEESLCSKISTFSPYEAINHWLLDLSKYR